MQFQKFTIKAQEAVQSAQELASSRQHPSLEPLHLLLALVQQDEGVVPALLQKLGIQPGALAQQIESSLSKRPTVQGAQLALDPELDRAFREALSEMEKLGDQFISTEHLLLALLERKGSKELLSAAGLNRDALHQALQAVRGSHSVTDQNPEATYQALERYGRDLVELARRGKLDPVIGRDDEIRRCMQVLARRTKNNPVLIGEPGVGKTAIVEGLALRIVGRRAPRAARQAAHGARHGRADRGREVPRRVRGAPQGGAREVTERRRWCSSSTRLHTVVGAGKPPKARWTPATCSSRRWPAASCGLHRRDHARRVPQARREGRGPRAALPADPSSASPASRTPSRSCAGSRSATTRTTACAFRTAALVAAATLSNRYIADRFLPDKAIDLIDEAASRLRIENDSLPAELDELRRQIMQLEIEREALKKERTHREQGAA
jgi:ATP-dependent Clp protease ATP-binding subunit ClpB